MKLVILIPAFNEEESIGKTILSISKTLPGIDKIEILVVDDGSIDKTVDLAMNAGADKIISHKKNIGVGAAFMTGVRNAISMNADIVVNIDADFTLDAKEIPLLIGPIISNQFDVVIGTRFIKNIPTDFPKIKIVVNKIFTQVVSLATGQKFSDTQTGFRAYSKEALQNISVVNDFTYTQEVLIDLKFKGFRIGEVPISIKSYRKDSRVVKSIFGYSWRALSIIIRSLVFHRPILAFGILGIVLFAGGILAKITTILDVLSVSSGLSTGLIILGIVSFMMGLFAGVVFKRQTFAEKEIRHFVKETVKDE